MISIVIPTYNRAKFVERTFDSYLAQDEVSEIIFVNDASTDNTVEVLSRIMLTDKRVRFVSHPRNKGLPASRNTGISQAKGEFVLFGEDDVVFDRSYSQTLLQHLRHQNCDIIAGRLIYLTEDGGQKLELDMPVIDNRAFIGHFSANPTDDLEVPFVHSCSLIRRKVFANVLFDDRSYRVNAFREETDFYINAISKGYKVCFCPHAFASHLARERDPRKRGGIWPRTSIEYKLWRQLNNVVFCWKNRKILASRFGTNFVRLELNFIVTTLLK